jgi:L-aminopeptidase/D-esterase-like protein
MITDVPGVRVGHWTDHEARTGCTAVLFPEGTVASGEVRGGAPATREFDLLAPQRLMQRLDAVVLSGGSAFGLAAADGAMRWLEQQGTGFPTSAGPVPIVVGAALFDLAVGDATVRPGAEEGYAACASARGGRFDVGRVGAGAGATINTWRGPDDRRPGGLGTATIRHGSLVVSALVALNAFGDVDVSRDEQDDLEAMAAFERTVGGAFGNTTLGVVATNATLDKTSCLVVAQGAHDGLARAIFPPHARVDGDAMVAAATCEVDGAADLVRVLALRAVEGAIQQAGSLR